jgi:hypothetical protein
MKELDLTTSSTDFSKLILLLKKILHFIILWNYFLMMITFTDESDTFFETIYYMTHDYFYKIFLIEDTT